MDPRDLKSMIDILGLPYDVDFSESDVESSYKFRARLYHPDMNKTKNAHAKFIELNNARDYVIANISYVKQIIKQNPSVFQNLYYNYNTKQEQERQRQEEQRRQEQERQRQEEQRRQEQERQRQEEQRRQEQERQRQEEHKLFEQEIKEHKVHVTDTFENYISELNKKDYSELNYKKILIIANQFKENIRNATSVNELNLYFNNSMNKVKSIYTKKKKRKLINLSIFLGMSLIIFSIILVSINYQNGKQPTFFVKQDGTIEFTGFENIFFSKFKNDLVIPTEINEISVTSIGEEALSGYNKVRSIKMPDSVTSIGDKAFFGCSSLTSITIPDSVTSIGSSAFSGCSSLTSITIPNSVTSIGDKAFFGCSSLTSITIPFVGTSKEETGSSSYFGCIFGTSSYTGSYSANGYYLPSTLKEVIITDALNIGYSAFKGCSSLTSITIPDSVTSIGISAFRGCSSLTSITIPDSVTSIGAFAFYGCSSLTSITIPDSVTSIGAFAFYGCSSLTSITIPDSVTSIESSAFSGCSSLLYNDFDNGYYLGNSSNPYLALVKAKNNSISTCVINKDTKIILSYAFKGCSSLTSITIPDSVTSIGSSAFSGCSSLTSIIIPDSVTSIGYQAFYGCSSLTSITIPDSVTSIESSAFSNCRKLTIYVEAPSKPSGWNSNWNSSNRPVVWGYNG